MSNLVTHMRTSAEAGNVDAQFNLAVILANGFDDRGRFIGAQREEALTWLQKAADAGLCRAQCKLAQTFAENDSPEDQETACTWFLVALDNRDGGSRQAARDGYEKLARIMAPEQLERARKTARAWRVKIKTGRNAREQAINALATKRWA
ncbi:MAG: repeat, subfamily [Rhodospirillales bacterium]|jgi:TPR repeat protein|nr:repeat, subfamily [Rhodospirillales bacterium]